MDDLRDEGLCDDEVSQDEPQITYPISCSNVPDSLFDDGGAAARQHFGKFGIIAKILLRPLKQSCIVEYERRDSAERAILNGGAYDGFMFDVTWSKHKKRPKVNDDPEWLPDPDVAAELAAMSNSVASLPRLHRQQKMEIEKVSPILTSKRQPVKKIPVKKKVKPVEKEKSVIPLASQSVRALDREELRQLVGRAWCTTEEKLKALEIRDRVIRASLSARHGAIKGCCPDMCPERERLVREFQRQVAPYETDLSDQSLGRLDPTRAVKQYSRSSADQEEPLAHELRPVPVLQNTLLYLLHHIIDQCDDPQTSLEDWFHFLWDRLRAIRKDITQQALCCKGSVSLVEACARFHAHCAARLVEEPPSTFDQRLNTENLSKCLQSLKYMYGDLRARGQADCCEREPEFRAYVVLLNMHDSNFMWEVQHLDPEVQSSSEIRFAIKVFTALDNNNYVKFFKLVRDTSYLNACILLRYFNHVRACALTRMIKSYSPRGVSQFPANELMEMLAFETLDSMELFLEHYGLQMITDQDYTYVVLDRNAFRDNDTPHSQERAVNLVESKLNISLGEVVYGNVLPASHFTSYKPHSSFEPSGHIKKTAILAEDQGYQPPKDRAQEIANILKNPALSSSKISSDPRLHETNKNTQTSKIPVIPNRVKNTDFTFAKPEIPKGVFSQNVFNTNSTDQANKFEGGDASLFKKVGGDAEHNNLFQKQPGSNIFSNTDNKFIFSKPVDAEHPKSLWQNQTGGSLFSKEITEADSASRSQIFSGQIEKPSNPLVFSSSAIFPPAPSGSAIFGNKPIPSEVDSANIFKLANNASTAPSPASIFNTAASSLFGNAVAKIGHVDNSKSIREEEHRKFIEMERKKKEEEERKMQEKIREEIRKQEELKRKIEEERKASELAKQRAELAKQKAEYERLERERKQKELEIRIEKQLQEIIPDITNEVVNNLCVHIMQEELDRLQELIKFADNVSEDLIMDVCEEECNFGIQAAVRLDEIRVRMICRSVARLWRSQVARSCRRRSLLHMTPAWLPGRPPPPPLPSQPQAIQRMKDFHRGKLPIFRMPGISRNQTINLFETVKKSLFKRSQELKKKSVSLNVYWKVVTSVPDENESKRCSHFFINWFKELFTDNQIEPHNHQIYLSENYWYKKFAISICNVRGGDVTKSGSKASEAMSGLNGLIFYGNTNFETLPCLMKRINNTLLSKCDFECIPVALVLVSPDSGDVTALESHLNEYKSHKFISEFKIIKSPKFDEDNLGVSTKEAFKWLAKGIPRSLAIESELLSTFLDHCIGSELWYRFKLSLHSSLRKAFHNVKTIIDLYNEAVGKAVEIVSNPELYKYPVSPCEFQEFLSYTHVYPKEYEHISGNWKSNIAALKNIIGSFKMPQYAEEWPPLSFADFQEPLRKFVFKLNWFSNAEKVVLRIFSIMKDDVSDEELSFDGRNEDKFSWIEIMNILISEKISETVNSLRNKLPNSEYLPDPYSQDFTVVYRPKDMNHYRTTPWWYKSEYTQDVRLLVEDYPDDMSDLDVSNPKKRKLDLSDDSEVLDDTWVSTVLTDMEETIKQTSQCHKIFTDLEKTIEVEKQKQAELEKLLRSALGDDWDPNV